MAQPIVFAQLPSTSSGIKFFNSYRGSRVITSKQVQFMFDKELLIPTDEICQKTTGTFDVIACIRRLREKAMVQTSGGNAVYVREVVLYDTTGHIILSVLSDMMDTIEEDNLSCFTQILLKNYVGRGFFKGVFL